MHPNSQLLDLGHKVQPQRRLLLGARQKSSEEVNWASNHPKAGDDCASYELNPGTGKPEIKSGNCADEKLFMCDVFHII
jgi:hypothetical protein